MKGLIFDIKRFAVHDGPGIRTTIFFKGCPLSCWWCHNPESCSINSEIVEKKHRLAGKIFRSLEQIGEMMSVERVMHEIDKEAVFYDESGGGVTLSGGEPLLQPDFAIALLKACRDKEYHTALDTSGFVQPEVLERAAQYTDLFLFDLKHHDPEKHQKFTGVELFPVLENLKLLIDAQKQVRIRIPVIPGVNDKNQDMAAFASLLKGMRFNGQVDLLPFHNMAHSKYDRLSQENRMKSLKNMKKSDLLPVKQFLEEQGFKVKIGG